MEKITDISREGLTIQKLLQLFLLLFPANNTALAKVDDFSSLDIAEINKQFWLEIKGVILDIDECVAPHHGEILPENIEAIKCLQRQVRILVFSNIKKTDRYAELEELGIRVHLSRYAKPDPRGFEECCAELSMQSNEVLMIGDNFMTDGGAVRAGCHFAKVKPITTDEKWHKKLRRLPQIASRKYAEIISDLYDVIFNRKILKDIDFI
ncbi:HAD hydrolase-like protein [Candidatus Peregrinibacteria bacterium]|nr:HAD hydrolase-like protein [Candidatus Peregrinibacteria bacterium]